jgi:hypothetical protein
MTESMTLQEVRISNGYLRKQIDIHKKNFSDLEGKYKKLLLFINKEIDMREYVCTTNHASLLDNAKNLLREIGELK